MKTTFAISWNDSKNGRALLGMTAMALALSVASAPMAPRALELAAGELVSVIVREAPGATDAPERMVSELGGNVERHIGVINGFTAEVPKRNLARLEALAEVHSVTLDRPIAMQDADDFDAEEDAGSMYNAIKTTRASDLHKQGVTGAGVDVAVVDTGVLPVEGVAPKIVNGPDLSLEGPAPNLRHLDGYGHGTHVAGIIAGADSTDYSDDDSFTGIAPGARLVNVKVANATGATDVSQVLMAIDWVVRNRNSNGMNIRVLNLSFGTDGTQSYLEDPLTYAVEVAWHKGIAVVVAAGNQQFGTSKLNNPAYDPFVIAVGADDTNGTLGVEDDVVPAWSARGDGTRNPDLVAPGKSLVSLRAPGSHIDLTHPEGRVSERFFRGSGTSQAAAVVSGAAALLIQQRPGITPDQLKHLLMTTASSLPAADAEAQGSGLINLEAAGGAPTPNYVQPWPRATGDGQCDCKLEGSRGSVHVVSPNGVTLEGEIDVFGNTWSGNTWSRNTWSGNTWSGNTWSGNTWSGGTWMGNTWSGNTWSGNTWSGNTWSGNTWSGNTWSGNTWSGNTWSGNTWSGNTWSGNTWSGNTWSGNTWSASVWGG